MKRVQRSTLLAKRLRELRGSRRQADVAAQLGYSAPLLSSWERAEATPSVEHIGELAHLYAEDGQAGVLMRELLQARNSVAPAVAMPSETELLQEIRWLLVQIRDKLYD